MYYYFLYILNTLLFITIILLIYLKQSKNKENFITWYKPYYNEKITENPLLNINEIYNERIVSIAKIIIC